MNVFLVPKPMAFRWGGLLLPFFLVPTGCGDGGDSGPAAVVEAEPEPTRGRWGIYRTHRFDTDMTEEQQAEVRQLEALGYLGGSTPAPSRSSVVVHDRDQAWPGLNFYTSGHAAEAVLMDMDGTVLHRWSRPFLDVWPDYPGAEGKQDTGFWRRAHLFANGDILVIHEGLGLLKLDRDSNVIWAHPYRAHHDLEVFADGQILVLTREAHMVPGVRRDKPVLEDKVTRLAEDGTEMETVSLLECYENAGPEESWRTASKRFWAKERERRIASPATDIFHTNSLRILDGGLEAINPALRAGRILVSFCHLDRIAVVDLEERRVVWSQGGYALQHDPRVVSDGILVFDNHWKPRTASRVVVTSPADNGVVWQYGGPDAGFFSSTCGAAHELPNRNILITETDGGRAFEVTRDGTIVWEFYNPHRAGPGDMYIASLFEVRRFPRDYATWLP